MYNENEAVTKGGFASQRESALWYSWKYVQRSIYRVTNFSVRRKLSVTIFISSGLKVCSLAKAQSLSHLVTVDGIAYEIFSSDG